MMEVDDAVMEIDDEGASLGWCFAVTSLCATVHSSWTAEVTSPPQAQGCATERSGDHRPENCAHVGGTDRR